MNSISIIEFLLVGAIVFIQTSLALKTRSQIKILAKIIPGAKNLKLYKYIIPIGVLKNSEPKEVLQNLAVYEKQAKAQLEAVYSENGGGVSDLLIELEDGEYGSQNEVSLINPSQKFNIIFDEILVAINVYLLRNKGAATDFNLIKDVVERNLDMEEEDISHTVTIPLYLGLMGTMVGIVFGLINLFLVSDPNSDFDIKAFLGGVSIAMFASFWGLFCTVANSSFNLKSARRSLEKEKNGFYTFLQTVLLPVLNQSVSSSIHSLHTNLANFTNQFAHNLNVLDGLLRKNHDALIAQERILTALDNIDITEFAKANVKILRELKTGTEQLERFSEYLNSLNLLASKTSKLSVSFDNLLSRVNNFEGLAEKLDTRVNESNLLIQFLNDHFQQLNARSDLIVNSVVRVDDVMIKALNQLEEHTQAKIESIKQNAISVEDLMMKTLGQIEEHVNEKIEAIKAITEKEEDLLSETFAENRSHISKLALLEDLKISLNEIKMSTAGQVGSLKEEVKSINVNIEKSNRVLSELNNKVIFHSNTSLAQKIRQMFGSKKRQNESEA